MSTFDEPKIVINGVQLSAGMAMTVRVAINNFTIDLSEPDALGDDDIGRGIAQGYRDNIQAINKIMLKKDAILFSSEYIPIREDL